MHAVLLDTNVWSWTLLGNQQLTHAAQDANDRARTRYLSPVSLYEVGQKGRLGKWPEMVPHMHQLRELAEAQGLDLAMLDGDICLRAGVMSWSHRDPFDRIIAATALHYGMPIISADPVFDEVASRIW